jgi:hypothetical protein
MRPFEFIILFFSFIYTLALTHLLFAATRMIRHRRSLVFSWPHALWMACALAILGLNWLSLWDFHALKTMSLPTIASGFALVVIQYFICALVTPDFEDGDSFDLRAFHAREHRTYIAGFAVLVGLALILNAAAGSGLGLKNWANENGITAAMVVPVSVALFVNRPWVQVAAPLLLLGLCIAFPIFYYPTLS